MFSFPRVDLDQGRPRVPSFYALEVLRAAEGRLPGFDELDNRAAGRAGARLGWPAPRDPPMRLMTPNSIWQCSIAWRAGSRDHYRRGQLSARRPIRISRGRCARGRGDGSGDGRRRTGWSIPRRRCARHWAKHQSRRAFLFGHRASAFRGLPVSLSALRGPSNPAARRGRGDRGGRSAHSRRAAARGPVRVADAASRGRPPAGYERGPGRGAPA